MRIISGKRKGLKLFSPSGKNTRPTEDRIKESLFNILGNVSDSIVLDLFSGTGNIGLEFLSRGAKEVYLVENNKLSLDTIKKNIDKINLPGIKLLSLDYLNALTKLKKDNIKFDYVYIDPPYEKINLYEKSLKFILEEDIFVDSLIILETKDGLIIDNINNFNIIDERKYRDTILYFLRRNK